MERGDRHNEGKLRYDLEHPIAREGLVKVLTKGATKYAPRNWEKGMPWMEVVASLERHLAAFKKGEDRDESGELHIDHIQCNAHFLSAFYKIAPQFDDRPKYTQKRVNKKIGLDIDEVLCDWLGGWLEKYNISERPHSWLFDRLIAPRVEEMKKEGSFDDFILSLRPLIDPKTIPFEPHCYITARHVDNSVSERWLDIHGFPAAPVYTTAPNTTKVEIAKRVGVEIFVDDNYKNFVELNEAGILCYLYDTPHNQRYDVGTKRIYSLNDVIYG